MPTTDKLGRFVARPVAAGMKWCPRCKQERPLDDFSHSTDRHDRRQAMCRDCQRIRMRQRRDRDPAHANAVSRRANIKAKYGLTVEEYEAMRARGCAICGATDRQMVIDHCHRRGAVRDALCGLCNTGLGYFQDDPDRLEAAAAYLRHHSAS